MEEAGGVESTGERAAAPHEDKGWGGGHQRGGLWRDWRVKARAGEWRAAARDGGVEAAEGRVVAPRREKMGGGSGGCILKEKGGGFPLVYKTNNL